MCGDTARRAWSICIHKRPVIGSKGVRLHRKPDAGFMFRPATIMWVHRPDRPGCGAVRLLVPPAGHRSVGLNDKHCQANYPGPVTTMNVSLPEELKTFVDERVADDGYGSTSEYVRDLIRHDRERQHLRNLLLEGANSGPGVVADDEYFTALRERISAGA